MYQQQKHPRCSSGDGNAPARQRLPRLLRQHLQRPRADEGRPVHTDNPPAVSGPGAAVAAVHPPGRCCWKRPFSSHTRSRRPWSDFLRSSLTFRLELRPPAVGWKAVGRGSPMSRGSQKTDGSAGPGIPVRPDNKRGGGSVWLALVRARRALQGCSALPCARVNGDGNARLMRFPETPQDQ